MCTFADGLGGRDPVLRTRAKSAARSNVKSHRAAESVRARRDGFGRREARDPVGLRAPLLRSQSYGPRVEAVAERG